MAASEPPNPFYWLLLLVSFLFVMTALAYAVVPVLEERAMEAGQTPPPSPFRATLRADGGRYLLYEVAGIIVFGLLSMAFDRLRSLQKQRAAGKIAPTKDDGASP